MALDRGTEYALSFTSDAVHLLRRDGSATRPDWQAVGSVDFTSTGFRGELAALHRHAAGEAEILPVTLLIPQDQILYTSLSVPAGARRSATVGQALDGLTPYAIDELAFDWTDEGAEVRVAAVARQTLFEAQEFALRHGFDGIGYSALPEDGDYPGVPVFALEPAQDEPATQPGDLAAGVVAGAEALSLDLDADLPDERASEAQDNDIDNAAAPASEDITDIAYEEVEAVVGDEAQGDEAQPELSGLDLEPEPEAEMVAQSAELADVDDIATVPDGQGDLFQAEDGAEEPPHAAKQAADAEGLAQPQNDYPADSEDATESRSNDAEGADFDIFFSDDTPMPVAAVKEEAAVAAEADPQETDQQADGGDDAGWDAAAMDDGSVAEDADEQAEAPAADEGVEQDDLTEAEQAALAAAAEEVALAEAAALRAGPTVVRHAPAAPMRAPRAAPQPDEADASRYAEYRRRGGLVELVAMLGALIVGLLLVWAFIVPSNKMPTGAGVIAANDPVTVQPADVVAPSDPVAPMDPAPADMTIAEAEPGIAPAPQAVPQTAPQTVPQTVPVAAPVDAPTNVTVPANPGAAQIDTAAAPVSALSPEERAQLIALATGPAQLIILPPAPAAAPSALPESDPVRPSNTQTGDTPEGGQAPARTPAPVARPATPQVATQGVETIARPQPSVPTTGANPDATASASNRTPETAPARSAAEPARPRLTSSARPASAPKRRAAAPAADVPPSVPDNPLPPETAQRRVAPTTAARPPNRPSVSRALRQATSAAPPPAPQQPAAQPAAAVVREPAAASRPAASVSGLRSSSRPPSRPEGSIPDTVSDDLTPAERRHIDAVLRDLRSARNGDAGLSRAERGAVFQLADARPQRRPSAIGARSQSAATGVDSASVEQAVRSAAGAAPPVSRPADAPPAGSNASTVPARDSGGLLRSSTRPRGKPGGGAAGNGTSGAISEALSEAVASAPVASSVSAGGVSAGGVGFAALTSSHLPPRRSGSAAPAAPSDSPSAAPAAAPAPEPSGPSDSEVAERRRLDEQLQSQAEARIRARAAADAAAEAQARAQAEARARAQVAAEERAAAARRQTYRPQELDEEPDVALTLPKGATSATVASAATQARGIDMGRTTVIGIIGAGQASRALIRLRNGKIVTVRLGDRIDGGTINSIGDGRITYVKNGRPHELRMLGGR